MISREEGNAFGGPPDGDGWGEGANRGQVTGRGGGPGPPLPVTIAGDAFGHGTPRCGRQGDGLGSGGGHAGDGPLDRWG
jgi:hypothetical protein